MSHRNRVSKIGAEVIKNKLPSASQEILPHDKTGPKRGFEDVGYSQRDLSNLAFTLAVFDKADNSFWRVVGIDYRGMRYELAGERMSKFVSMSQDVVLFQFTNETWFKELYDLYYKSRVETGERIRLQHHIFDWLAEDSSRLGLTIERKIEREEQNKKDLENDKKQNT